MNTKHDLAREMSVALLPTPERLFLWTTRAWSAYHTDLTAVWWSLDRAFRQEHIHSVLPMFHQLMTALFDGLHRWPDIRCVACPRLGLHEARLLAMYTHVQHGNEVAARSTLQDWVVRSAIRIVCKQATECAVIASAAGLHFQFMKPRGSLQIAQEADQPECAHSPHTSDVVGTELLVH